MSSFQLPLYILTEILNRVEDAVDISKCQLVCKDFRDAGKSVRSLRILVLNDYHENARSSIHMKSLSLAESSTAGSSNTKKVGGPTLPIKEMIVRFLKGKDCLLQLRLEIDPKLQAKSVREDERQKTDFWMSDHRFLKQCVNPFASTLQHLCIVDYGQQSIMRKSSIMSILSVTCNRLKTLDLRNMFIDMSDCHRMTSLTSLTWRCVKVNGAALRNVKDSMTNLSTLALLGVFGAEGGNLTFQHMTVLCLGLSTPAEDLVMNLPTLKKLQLKMQCPKNLVIIAPVLRYVAFNLEVPESSKVELKCIDAVPKSTSSHTVTESHINYSGQVEGAGLEELLYGAASFIPMSSLVEKNPNLKKVFLDIPCMTLAEDGRFLAPLKDVPLSLPSFDHLRNLRKLEVLNIGPGLWYSLEAKVDTLISVEKWPVINTLYLHMIPHNREASLKVLGLLLGTSVTSLKIFIHSSSPVSRDELATGIEEQVSACELRSGNIIICKVLSWTKSLDFSCFSF